MEKKDEELILAVMNHDTELKHYYEEHVALERQLEEFDRRLYLTPEQEVERKQIQKRKLHGKDRLMELLQKHRTTGHDAGA